MAAHPIAPPLTVDEFLHVRGENDDNRCELVDGEVLERPLTGYTHDRVKTNLNRLFDRAGIDQLGFESWVEHSFRVTELDAFTPDVAIIRKERLTGRTDNSPTTGAPEIAIEVAINDKPSALQHKISTYLKNGAHAVCCAYPDGKYVVVYTAHEWRQLRIDDTLEFATLLPGIIISIAAIFEGV
ncbi:MAG TPA: Uma2 family endonuclease [Bryobacteraceae bacterium]|nr:Uma2 family endonuclease [Bryobacteraceae bacterium]